MVSWEERAKKLASSRVKVDGEKEGAAAWRRSFELVAKRVAFMAHLHRIESYLGRQNQGPRGVNYPYILEKAVLELILEAEASKRAPLPRFLASSPPSRSSPLLELIRRVFASCLFMGSSLAMRGSYYDDLLFVSSSQA